MMCLCDCLRCDVSAVRASSETTVMACVRESESESSVGAIESAESDEREMRVSDAVCVSRSACDGARERRDGGQPFVGETRGLRPLRAYEPRPAAPPACSETLCATCALCVLLHVDVSARKIYRNVR